jgi:hypothetical protein
MMKGGRETKDKKKGGINNCRWSRMIKGGREIKKKKKGDIKN